MANLLKSIPVGEIIAKSKPILEKSLYYAKVELVPPKISDIPAIRNGISNLIRSAKNKRYLQVSVREAWLNTLVSIEVLCWFFVGECIGKRHLIGYDV
ncbi:ATP synthase F(0) complex subunit g, mitochondrial [Xylocopa sonorina]|uniref:ATP synthase F(0) complex subunit g, mitochondrial n=1 Tax=Xylocopa sonorina TaxID=1818115 RepID=UPI00403AF1E4